MLGRDGSDGTAAAVAFPGVLLAIQGAGPGAAPAPLPAFAALPTQHGTPYSAYSTFAAVPTPSSGAAASSAAGPTDAARLAHLEAEVQRLAAALAALQQAVNGLENGRSWG
jgi:hypothetical protein